MATMTVKDIMTKGSKVVTAGPKDKVADVIVKLVTKKVSGLPVVDDAGMVVGVITEADVLTARSTASVAKVIGDTKPITIRPEVAISKVAELLVAKKIKRVPVVDSEGKLLGVVSRTDILKTKVKK